MSDFSKDIAPPGRVESRVVAALRARGLLKPERPARSVAAIAAAALILVTAGYAAGRWHASNTTFPVAPGPQFVLLLHDTPLTLATGIPESDLVEEYRRWAQQVSAAGNAISGEKLKDLPGDTLGGFFIVRAPSIEAARAIAATCPHARLGGRIEIREIDPT